jgi:hypothetical protein
MEGPIIMEAITMLKKLIIATAASGLMMSTALAQQTTPPAAAPSATAPSAATRSDAKFISAQSADQWVASKFKGTDVIGANNEKIGDVDDLLFSKDGKILAVVVGVGGFLGIGQKDVALDMTAFQVVPADTGSTAAAASTTASSNDPSKIKLKLAMTKDELKAAPAFEYYKAPSRTTSNPAAAPNTGMAPRPAPTPKP